MPLSLVCLSVYVYVYVCVCFSVAYRTTKAIDDDEKTTNKDCIVIRSVDGAIKKGAEGLVSIIAIDKQQARETRIVEKKINVTKVSNRSDRPQSADSQFDTP